jgi:hypothetical protein
VPDRLPPILEAFGADLARAEDPPGHRAPRFAMRRPRAILIAVVLAATGGPALGIELGGSGSSVASAASVLAAAARAAEHGRVLPPSSTFFFYTRTVATTLISIRYPPGGKFTAPWARVRFETWETWSLKRRGVIVMRVLKIMFPTAVARERWERLGRPNLTKGLVITRPVAISPFRRVVLPDGSLTTSQLFMLPVEPTRLYQRLFQGKPAEVALGTVETLDQYPISPKLRAALYRALALVPGIRLYGHASSLAHRSGEAIGTTFPGGQFRYELIIDPDTGELLGHKNIIVKARRSADLPAGSVFSQTALISRGISAGRFAAGMPR